MSESWLDANVVLRYILKDHPEHSPRARELIVDANDRGEKLKVAPFTLAEVVYVLEGEDCRFGPDDVHQALVTLSREPAIEFQQAPEIFEALIDHRDQNVDFADALLMAVARRRGERVWTFNRKHFRRLDGDWAEPAGK